MHITNRMIHPQLRIPGVVIRTVFPAFNEKSLRFTRIFLRKFLKGQYRGSSANYTQRYLPRPDGSKLRLCIYTPKQPKKNAPGLLWLHGGGFAFGIPEQDHSYIERFIESTHCVVIAPDYRLSSEAPYPAALKDCYAALLWMKKHALEYLINPNQLMVAGMSAGGGLTAALSLYARDKGTVSIACQFPLYPMLDDRLNTPSMVDNDAPIWNYPSNHLAWREYLGEDFGTDGVSPYAAPSREHNFKELPPTCSFIGTIDPFHDETLRYIRALRSANIPVHFQEFEGGYHAFEKICPHSSIGQQAIHFLMDSFVYATKHYYAPQPME